MDYREKWFQNNNSNHGWYTCARCGKKIRKADVDIDHIIPQKHGGKDELYNLQCLCKHCNRSKQASMKDTAPDLAKTNGKRLVKAVKKNLHFVKNHVVEGVKRVTKKIVKDDDDDKSKKTATTKKTVAKKNGTSKADTSKTVATKKTSTAKVKGAAKASSTVPAAGTAKAKGSAKLSSTTKNTKN